MISPITNEMLMKVMHKERQLEVERLCLASQGRPARVAHSKHLFQWRLLKKPLKAVSNNIKHKATKRGQRTCQSST